MCTHTFLELDSTRVCTTCGVEEYILRNCSFTNCGFCMRHSPFLSGYSRAKRFRGMMDSLFFPTPSNADTHMLEYLMTRKFRSRNQLIAAVSRAPVKDKRFGSIHLFCKLMDPNYVEPVHGCLFEIMRRMAFEFAEIECSFQRTFEGQPFINYTYLLRFLLTCFGLTEYLKFVKNMKCKKRQLRYNKMLKQCYSSMPSAIGGTFSVSEL